MRHDAAPRDRVVAAASDFATWWRTAPKSFESGTSAHTPRGDYAPGSDFDVLMEVADTTVPRRPRAFAYLPDTFPVGIDLIVYTSEEIARLRQEKGAFIAAIDREFTPLA